MSRSATHTAQTTDVSSVASRAWRFAGAAIKLALAAYFMYVVLLRPGLPWYAYPVVALIAFSAYRIVARSPADRRFWWVYLAGALLFGQLWFFADETGVPVRFGYAIDLERLLFAGEVPTAWLQERLYHPGERGPLDWTSIVVYASYFLAPHMVALLVWRRSPSTFRTYTTAYVGLLFAALALFAVAPTAPPWMAAQEGHLAGVARIVLETSSAFSPQFYEPGYELALGNAVAAMPSVHAGVTAIVAFAAWRSGRRALRAGAVAYALAMGFALVYLGEHYVVDLLAGALLALATWSASSAWWRRRDRALAGEDGLLAGAPGTRERVRA
jgi:membrane-associated phospholipid phosphatase